MCPEGVALGDAADNAALRSPEGAASALRRLSPMAKAVFRFLKLVGSVKLLALRVGCGLMSSGGSP